MKKLWNFGMAIYKKYQEVISYLFFGFLAFIVNMAAYMAAANVMGANKDTPLEVTLATMFAWVVSVIFAYWTNHSFVFKTKLNSRKELMREFMTFVGARIITGGMELIIMNVMTGLLDVNDRFSKLVCNFIVILSNYIFSKLWIFKKKES